MKKQVFNINDLVVCEDADDMEEVITEGQMYTVKGISNDSLIEILSDNGRIEGAFLRRFSLYSGKNHQVGTIFSVLNEKEAAPYIGRIVECCDPTEYRKGEWNKGLFEKLRGEESESPFSVEVEGSEIYTLIRLIPESFEEPKPKVDPGLIEALKKSIQQWQIMHDTGKSKYEVYKFLGGSSLDMACFLCNLFGVVGGGGAHKCRKCIDWKARYCHDGGNSPFEKYRTDPYSKPAISGVLNHLKSELVRLESLSK